MAYVDQFDRLIRADDRGRAIRNTRTIVVFDDGLVVCAVRVYGTAAGPASSLLGGLRRSGRAARQASGSSGDEQIRLSAEATGSCLTFAPAWPKAQPIPFAIIEKVVLSRPRQVTELAICEQTTGQATPATSTYLGDLSADRVRAALAPALGDRLEIHVPA